MLVIYNWVENIFEEKILRNLGIANKFTQMIKRHINKYSSILHKIKNREKLCVVAK